MAKKKAKKKTSSRANKDVTISIKAPKCQYVLYSVNVIKKSVILSSDDNKDGVVTKSLKKKYHNQFVLTVSGKKGASVVIDAGKARRAIRYKFSNTETIDIPFGISI